MQNFGAFVSHYGVDNHGIKNPGTVYWNLTTAMLYEHVTRKDEGKIAHLGPLVVQTGGHTGRSPNDRFVVKEPESESKIWWGKVNRPFSQENFDYLYRKMLAYVQNRDIYVFDGYVGAIRLTGCRFASSPNMPGTTCSRVICSSASLTRKNCATTCRSLRSSTCPGSRRNLNSTAQTARHSSSWTSVAVSY